MNKTLIGSFVGLLLGAAVGGFAGYFYGKNKYLAIAEKEIDSVKFLINGEVNEKLQDIYVRNI